MSTELTAESFVVALMTYQSDDELQKIQRYFKTAKGDYGEGDTFVGVRMGHVFQLAKQFIDLPPNEIEALLESPIHEVRAGGLSIMGKQAARKRTPDSRRKELYELYLRRTDRINNWDLVDLSSHHVVGGYLFDKPRDILYRLARSNNLWERRIAIYSTLYFVRNEDVDDTFRIAEILLHDGHDLIHKVTGTLLRTAGDKDGPRLLAFLDRHATTMPRTMLRTAIQHLDSGLQEYYRGIRGAAGPHAQLQHLPTKHAATMPA